jgi:hypothetical protein
MTRSEIRGDLEKQGVNVTLSGEHLQIAVSASSTIS